MSGRWSRAPRLRRLTSTGWALATASSWRARGWPRLLPVNVVISTNFRCNFKCLTCNVYERKVKELDVDEWGRVFASMGRAPTWMTFSGGEPFLRGDLPDIILSAIRHCEPAVVRQLPPPVHRRRRRRHRLRRDQRRLRAAASRWVEAR